MTQIQKIDVERAADEAIDRLRAKHALNHLDRAGESLRPGSATAFLVRVALGVIYMYLIVASYLMMDAFGPVLVSLLFLAAILVPHFFRYVSRPSQVRRAQTEQTTVVEETP